jgi:hypothetical protein
MKKGPTSSLISVAALFFLLFATLEAVRAQSTVDAGAMTSLLPELHVNHSITVWFDKLNPIHSKSLNVSCVQL